jgi:hypothetical protein
MLTLACLNSESGNKFVVLEHGQGDDARICGSGRRSDVRIGDCYAILEPNPVTKYILESVPIVYSTRSWVALKAPLFPFIEFKNRDVNQQLFFSGTNLNIKTHSVNVLQSACNGVFCDCQKISNEKIEPCGCYTQRSRNAGQWLSQDMLVELPDGFAGETETVRHFRSLRTMDVLFTNALPSVSAQLFASSADLRRVRDKWDIIVDYINSHGGWTIGAWHRRGSVTDSGATDQSNVISDSLTVHIVYLYPTEVTKET